MKHPTERQLTKYVLQVLADKKREKVARHLETCRECRARMDEIKALEQGIRRSLAAHLGSPPPSRPTFQDLLPRIERTNKIAHFRLVAARVCGAAALVALGLLLLTRATSVLPPAPWVSNPYVYSYPTGEPGVIPFSPVSPNARLQVSWYVGEEEGAGAGMQAAAQAFVEAYNSSQSRIEIVLELGPAGEEHASYMASLRRAAFGGRPPSVVGPLTTEAVREIAGELPGAWLSLESRLSVFDREDFEPGVLEAWRVEEQLVALPIGTYPAVLAYDRDLFDEAGLPYPPASYGASYAGGGAWTIANLAETARQLTVDAAGSSAADADFDPLAIERWGFQGTTDDLATALGLFGAGSFVDGRGRAAISPNWREAIHWYRDAVCEDHTHLSAAAHAVWGTWPFRSGVVGMAYGPLWIVNQLGTEQNWDLAAVPAHDGMAGPSLDAGIAVGVLGTAVHAEEAFEVANAIASNPELAAAWGAYPARASVQGPFLDEMAARYPGVRWEVVVDGVERGELVDGAMPSVEAWSYGEELLARIESGEICAADVDAEIERLEAGLAASLSE